MFRILLVSISFVLSILIYSSAWANQPSRAIFVLDDNNHLRIGTDSVPIALSAPRRIALLDAGDVMRAIDVRPSNGGLYGLASNTATGRVQLYYLPIGSIGETIIANKLGSSGVFVDAAGSQIAITSNDFGIDFNPSFDRLRVVTRNDINFRMNPNTGAFIDGNFGGSPGSVPGLNPDGSISDGAIVASAHTNNVINTSFTTLYSVDEVTNALRIQSSPNAGTQSAFIPLLFAGNPLNVPDEAGFDIAPGAATATSNNAPVTAGTGYLVTSANGQSAIYRVNLVLGDTTLLGGLATPARGIAVSTDPTGLSLTTNPPALTRFPLATPNEVTGATMSGLAGGERIVGIDSNARDGNVYAIGVNVNAYSATLYLLDPRSGLLTAIGTPGQIQFVNAAGAIDGMIATSYGVDVDAVANVVKVAAANGLNFRVLVSSGLPIDGDLGGQTDSIAGMNADARITAIGAVIANAYSNNNTIIGPTSLYNLDDVSNQLWIQAPGNSGAQTPGPALSLAGVPFNVSASAGFDIPSGAITPVANQPVAGFGYISANTGGLPNLYRVNLATGALDDRGPMPIESDGLIVWNPEIDGSLFDRVFFDGFE
jgi:Domain of unknown function (DUF4394)